MQRNLIQQLVAWKKSPSRKPLVLNGARQVGKTWLLRQFAKENYKKEAYIVCRKNDLARQLFSENIDVQRILRGLRALSSVDITPGDTLIILDEVQDIPEAVECLKYFYEQAPDYHIAVAGSLLGISLHQNVSFPVGKVHVLQLYPMDFHEFLLAKGETETLKLMANKDYGTINLLHDKFIDLLRQYYYVGGMPEVVNEYVTTGALQNVRNLQNDILRGYEMDFSKHVPIAQISRVRQVWRSIPSQLFKENKKFIYGVLRKGARANEFELAIQWLIDAGLVYKVPRCKQLSLPLNAYEDLSAFKLYMCDIGLLCAMAGTDAATVLIKNDVFKEFKGGLTEQFVLQQLHCRGISPVCYYNTPDSRLEVDFVIQHGGTIVPIEVKAEGNVRSNSLSMLLQKRPEIHAVRYSMLPYKEQANITNIPLYAV